MLGNNATERLTEDADFGKKEIIFSDETHFNLDGHVIIVTENPPACIEKPTASTQYETLFGADFG